MGRIISQNLIPKKVLDFLQDHQHQISAENFTGWFKGSSQVDFDTAEGACQVLKAAGVSPEHLRDIKYAGTKEQWQTDVRFYGYCEPGVTIHCADGEVSVS